jgi:hypothetical protein
MKTIRNDRGILKLAASRLRMLHLLWCPAFFHEFLRKKYAFVSQDTHLASTIRKRRPSFFLKDLLRQTFELIIFNRLPDRLVLLSTHCVKTDRTLEHAGPTGVPGRRRIAVRWFLAIDRLPSLASGSAYPCHAWRDVRPGPGSRRSRVR